MDTHRIGHDITVLRNQFPAPGIGVVPINAFVLRAAEPVVIDTGLSLPERGFLEALGSVVDPNDVRWIYLTHADRDHTGGLFDLLEAAPRARLVTTFLSAGALSMERPIPMDRLYLLNPGQALDVGDRKLAAFRPPLFDNPGTIGLFDERSGACFSSDCFGAPLPDAELAGCDDVREVPADQLRSAQLLWASVDSPWVHVTDRAKYLATMEPLRVMDPAIILSTHLPPAVGRLPEFLDMLSAAPQADPFVGPDQQALAAMLAEFEPASAPG
ncbi:MAG TPA: MBL fold metallo-hydrolase [Propionibacteriaceae bacterium]|nr:MBL fold metallo-hydrolase [Propionibacteriaceae bacterium]